MVHRGRVHRTQVEDNFAYKNSEMRTTKKTKNLIIIIIIIIILILIIIIIIIIIEKRMMHLKKQYVYQSGSFPLKIRAYHPRSFASCSKTPFCVHLTHHLHYFAYI